MDINEELAMMQQRILLCKWNDFEQHYANSCRSVAPKEAKKVGTVDLGNYHTDRLFDAYCKALKKARQSSAAAIYYEYDIDNDWSSTFFICPEYNKVEVGNDDWACNYISDVRAPGIPEFTKIYKRLSGWCTSPVDTCITLYLISRTVVCLNEVVSRKPPKEFALCLAFHDQYPIHRLYEPRTA